MGVRGEEMRWKDRFSVLGTRAVPATGLVAFVLVLVLSMTVPTARANAACSVPNQISNGQVADATVLMGNLNAISDCINSVQNSVVSPSGTPAAGNLPVFSSPTTISPGNLSGDCTTSGTLAVTCTKTNGTPLGPFATGTDAGHLTGTISVNRFSNGLNADSSHFLRGDGLWAVPSGGGGSGNWWFKPPLASAFTPISADATPPTLTDDADEGLIVDVNVNSGIQRGGYVTLTDKTADWSLTVRMETFLPSVNYTNAGIWGRDSVSGKELILCLSNNVGIDWARMNSFRATRAARAGDGVIGASSSKIASDRSPLERVPTMLDPEVWMNGLPLPASASSSATTAPL